jgi:hypothetical protein
MPSFRCISGKRSRAIYVAAGRGNTLIMTLRFGRSKHDVGGATTATMFNSTFHENDDLFQPS